MLRVLIHVGGLNLLLVMRQLLGKGTPRGLQGLSAESLLMLLQFWIVVLVGKNRRAHRARCSCPYMLCASIFSFPSRQNEQITSAASC
jgi:hypothetical protein